MKEAPQWDERFRVESIPLVLVLGPDGKERARQEGYLPPAEMLGWLKGAVLGPR